MENSRQEIAIETVNRNMLLSEWEIIACDVPESSIFASALFVLYLHI